MEEAYRLCPACNDNICSEVYRQDADIRSKLLGQRLHQSVLPDTKVFKFKKSGNYSCVVQKKKCFIDLNLEAFYHLLCGCFTFTMSGTWCPFCVQSSGTTFYYFKKNGLISRNTITNNNTYLYRQ